MFDTECIATAGRIAPAQHYLKAFWQAAGGDAALLAHVAMTGDGALPSAFAVTDFAAAAISAAGLAMAELLALAGGAMPQVVVDKRLASFWFTASLRPQGWALPPIWDAVAGDYRAADGWIRLHTNAPHHRDAALAVLGAAADREAVARAVAGWRADELEAAVVERHGCAAAMRTLAEWAEHPQGRAVADEPLLRWRAGIRAAAPAWTPTRERPLRGVRVLDLTRVLAGPVATRFLAGFGAEVLRIDPHGWEEPGTVPEVTLGKRCARLDLKNPAGRARLERLLIGADVLVHGYRPDALERLGLGAARRRELNPGLVDVSLDAYGWTGPWRGRRGFDSLIQMSSGIADAGMRASGAERPLPLPNQALDHATGYLLAAAAIRGLSGRLASGEGCSAQASLARTARLLTAHANPGDAGPLSPERPEDLAGAVESTSWGAARRILPPLAIAGAPMHWAHPAGALGLAAAEWQ
ncbi:CoA transferase [Chromobacterium subtsugae]|uniref:CoA transferase n=1 Tax=Chromobacterium subtsugae TaxID=251747 RepID=UPI000641312B|nr:CoA transferase [Chromobacterium subtsugae]OBU88119.1 CAIB/BAIF family CoA transferase [Chromobacterium subtsugae]